jgi:hypothetical protein
MFRHSPFDRALPPLTYKCPSGRNPVAPAATRRHCHDRRGDDVRADRFGSRRLAPRELAAWMARRGLLFTDSKITAEMFDTALGGVDSKDSLLGANQIQGCFLGGSLGCDGPFGIERRDVGANGTADHRST